MDFRWYFLGPAIVFVVALCTSLRPQALGAAAAGAVAGWLGAAFFLDAPWWGVPSLLFILLAAIFAAMAFTEAVAASILARGGLLGAFALALAAHATLLWLVWENLDLLEDFEPIWMIPPALLGGAAAAFGARLGRK